MKKTLTILTLWLFWGFGLGTFVLLGPVRKTVDYTRTHGWSPQSEDSIVFGFMLLLVIISFAIAYLSSKYILSSSGTLKKTALVVVPLLATSFSLSVLLNPKYANGNEQSEVFDGFTIGPYPTKEKMEELKNAGYTTVISLLHTAVVPFEPKLLAEEQENAKQVGIKFINIPLLPWVSDNENAIETLRDLVRNAKGKYYIHCYLGKDRVNVARQIILQESNLKIHGLENFARSLDSIDSFERGPIFKLGKDVFLTPMPTKEEYFGYIIAAGYKQVVALKDLSEPGVEESIKEEQYWLEPYKIKLKVFDIGNGLSEADMKKITDSLNLMPRPLIIHTFTTDQPEAELLLKFYK